MRRIDSIKKRLDAIGASSHDWSEIEIDWQSRADTLASVLTGLGPDDENAFEMTRDDEKPATDGEKIRWLRQCPAAELEEIRAEWQASPGKRAKAALAELARLEPLLDSERPPQE
jgi:hypothetical protein